MRGDGGKLFLERVPPLARPVLRALVVVVSFFLWGIAQGSLSEVFGFIGNMILRHAVSGALALIVILPFWRLFPRSCGLNGTRDPLSVLCSSAALFLPFVVLAVTQGLLYASPGPEWILYSVSLMLLAASEEILCRGFFMDALSLSSNRWCGLVLSSLVFALLHLGNSHASFAGIANIFLAGAFFGLLRISTGGLLYPSIVHWLWNLMTGMVFGWSVSGHEQMPTFFRPLHHPPWGGFGPEESILMTVGTLGAIVLVLKHLASSDDHAFPDVHGTPRLEPEEVDP